MACNAFARSVCFADLSSGQLLVDWTEEALGVAIIAKGAGLGGFSTASTPTSQEPMEQSQLW
ncbi:hypothetical protein BTA51_24775 [Hahella sp. CCB-MM4]|nr:hypothetical protein BTA51_24775 [Hahella sp. CCB-MM4]